MAGVVEINFVQAFNELQVFNGLLVLDCRSKVEWERENIARSLPCPVTLKDVEAGRTIKEVVEENLPDFPIQSARALNCKGYATILYGEPEKTVLAEKLLREQNEASRIYFLKSQEVVRLREISPFCFTNKELLEENQSRRRLKYPNLILEEGLWVGAANQATNRAIVKDLRVSHILNVTKGVLCHFENDEELSIEYLKISIEDLTNVKISDYIPSAIAFIKKGLEEGSGILVHCMCGVSRSVSLVLAYLVSEKEMSLKEAFDLVRERRRIACPNVGFVRQLGEFEMSVRGSTTYTEVYKINWGDYKSNSGEQKNVRSLFDRNEHKCCEIL